MPFQTADNALIIVCQNTRIIRRTERISGSCSEWKEVALPLKARPRIKLQPVAGVTYIAFNHTTLPVIIFGLTVDVSLTSIATGIIAGEFIT